MHRVRRLHALWSWLPAFRVVAETEHLPTAADQLQVSAQALSRSIKLLEAELEVQLFRRVGRRLRLSNAGQRLLETVRTSMRILDDGIGELRGSALEGPANIAALAHHAWLVVLPALELLRERAPLVVPSVLSLGGDETRARLRSGAVDVAIEERPLSEPGFEVEQLIALRYGVWCGAAHPHYQRRDLDLDEILDTPFVVPPEDITDGWPPELPRAVGVRVSSFQLALELCLEGSYLAMLPDSVARANRSARPLRRLPVEIGEPRQLYLSYRRPIREHLLTEVVCQALRDAAASLTG